MFLLTNLQWPSLFYANYGTKEELLNAAQVAQENADRVLP